MLDQQTLNTRDLLEQAITDSQANVAVKERPVANISDRDGMMNPSSPTQYFSTGAAALALVQRAYQSLPLRHCPRAILDFGCGYGRVFRWLRAAYPSSHFVCADIDSNALAFISETFQAETFPCSEDLSDLRIELEFDLIWIGSLFTHIDEQSCNDLISSLVRLLRPGGILAFTTHGHYVESRLRTKTKTYGLADSQVEILLDELRTTRYGYAPYRNMSRNYGISVAYPHYYFEILNRLGLEPLLFEARGWVRHQDFFAAVRHQTRTLNHPQ